MTWLVWMSALRYDMTTKKNETSQIIFYTSLNANNGFNSPGRGRMLVVTYIMMRSQAPVGAQYFGINQQV